MAEAKFEISLESLEALGKQIAEVDQKIGAASGNEAAVRKSIAQAFVTENSEAVEKLVKQVLNTLEKADNVGLMIGVMDRLPDALEEAFSERTDELIDGKVKEATSGSAEDIAALKEGRKAQVEQFRALKIILETNFKVDTSSVPEPKRGGGRAAGSGTEKSGRNTEGLRYSLNGKERPASQNSFSALAYHSTLGCAEKDGKGNDQRWGVEQLREFLTGKGITVGKPGEGDDTWDVELPNGNKIGARRLADDEFVDAKDDETEGDSTSPDAEAAA
jgi:hypothetical protein